MVPLGTEENNARGWSKALDLHKRFPLTRQLKPAPAGLIREHATIGLVVTTDGSVAELPREKYLPAERRIIAELDEIGKPYLILLNCTEPDSEPAHALAAQMEEVYHHPVCPINAVNLTAEQLNNILQKLLYEFPLREIAVSMPSWVTMLEPGHWLQSSVYQALLELAGSVAQNGDMSPRQAPAELCQHNRRYPDRHGPCLRPRCSCGLVLSLISFSRFWARKPTFPSQMKPAFCLYGWSWLKPKRRMTKQSALEQVQATGYGIVMPGIEELHLEEPEIVRQGGQYGVRLSASAPACT